MSEDEAQVPTQTQSSRTSRADGDDLGRTCQQFVDRYREGSTSRARAVADISKALVEATPESTAGGDATDDALQSYLRMLDDVTSERSRRLGQSAGLEEEEGQPREEENRTYEGQQPAVARTEREESVVGEGQHHPRNPSIADEGQDRERADPAKYAWAGTGSVRADLLNDNLRATVELLRQYGVNIKQARRDLLLTVGAPEFPASEWDNILRGFAVDLDRVLEGLYSTANDDVEITELGPFTVTAPKQHSVKKVEDAGQWLFAWNRTVNATSFAFPLRLKELTEYGDHILGLFRVLAPQFHPRLLAYDRAVRKRVGLRRDLELTDYSSFGDLKILHIDSCGASSQGEGGNTGGGRVKSAARNRPRLTNEVEPCHRWNRGRCPQSAATCRYRHVCSRCGSGAHTYFDCSAK